MSYLLVATDFTEVGDNAVEYAAQLALWQNAQLNIVNFFSIPISFSEIPVPDINANMMKELADQTMTELVARLATTYPALKVVSSVIYDDAVDGINEYISKNGAPMIVVVGNSLSGDEFGFLDNTLIAALKHINFPMLAVPPGITFKPVSRICFAFDNKHKNNDVALVQLKTITETLKARLFIFNAQEDVMTRDNLPDIDDLAKKMLASLNPVYHIEYDVNINDAIEKYAILTHINWLAVLPRSYPFLESLFHRSHTKALAHKLVLPLLVLHEH